MASTILTSQEMLHLELDISQVELLRKVVIAGLAAEGELFLLQNAYKLCQICKEAVPESMKPIETLTSDTFTDFADALSSLEWPSQVELIPRRAVA